MSREGPTNAELAAALHEYAALLELAGPESHAARAFRRGADLIATTPLQVAGLVRSGRVRELRGIGPGIERRLVERIETGKIAEVEELRRETSPELAALGQLLGFGARRGASIGAALGITTADELRSAAAAGRLRDVRGIGPATEAAIKTALGRERAEPERSMRLDRAVELTARLAASLDGVAAGDARRWRDAPTRLAVVVATDRPDEVRAAFASQADIVALLEPEVGVTRDGLPVELHLTAPERLGTALVRATGSSAYVSSLGALPEAGSEQEVYRRLGLPFQPPELRELPTIVPPAGLVEVSDIRGDLHCHTTSSDGKASVLEMAEAARARGYEYLAICDHTKAVTVVPGLDADALRRQGEEIAAANDRLAPFRVLRGVECDIVGDGELDLPDDVLAELDWVQISLHAGQRTPRRELTARVTDAMQHPAVRCLSHPTGRLIGHRLENALDLERTFETALATGVALEVNGLPARLDLSGEHVREALAAGVNIVCSTDAHTPGGLGNMPLAVHTARRGGATAFRVLNTLLLRDLLAPLRGRSAGR